MAERKKIVVKSTKKSAISKVEIITVESNDVASLTARHPVGVVVAERRIPSHKPTTDQEPKPVFLPGCPLPQVLPPDYKTGNEISHTKGKPSTKESKPKFYRSKNYASDHKLRKAAKTVTFSIDNDVEMGRKYNPRDYMDSTRDSTSLRQLHTLMPSAEEKKYYNETLLTGPPHYVLVSKGLKNEIDPDSTDNSNSISWDSNTAVHNFSENSHLLSGSEELSSSDGKDQISVDTNSVAVRGIKDFIESSVSVETSEISTSDTVNDNGELGIFSEAIFDKKSQETSTSDSLKDAPLSPEIPQVISVKHGSLHVRQRPHFTGETKHMQNKDINLQRNASGGCKGEIQSVVSVSKRKTEKQRATDSRNPLPVRSRPINHLGALDKYSSASNKRHRLGVC